MQTELLSIQELRRDLFSLDDLYTEYNDFRKETAVLKKKYQGALYCLKSTRARLADLQRLNEQLQASFITVEDYQTIVSKSQIKENEYNNLQAEYNDFINSSELRYQNICHKYDETILSLELQSNLQQQENEDLMLKIEKLDKKQFCKKKLENDKPKLPDKSEKDCINEFELEKQRLLENEIKILNAKLEELEDKIRCLKLNNEAYEIRLKEQKEKHDEKIKNLSEQFEKEKCTLKQHFETILKKKDDEIKSVRKEVIKGNILLDGLDEANAVVTEDRCMTPIEFESLDLDEDAFQEALCLARSVQLVSPIPPSPEKAINTATSASSPIEEPRNQPNKLCDEDIRTGYKLITASSIVNCEDKQAEELCKKNVEVDKHILPIGKVVVNHTQELLNENTKETNKSSSSLSTANNFVQNQENELQSNVNSPSPRKRRIEHIKKLDKKPKLSIVTNKFNSTDSTRTAQIDCNVPQANNPVEKFKNPTFTHRNASNIDRCSNLPKEFRSVENFQNCKVNGVGESHEKNSRKLDQCYNLSATDGVWKFNNRSMNCRDSIENFDKFLSVALLSTKEPTTSTASQMQELQNKNIEGSCSTLPTTNDCGSLKLVRQLQEIQNGNIKGNGSYSNLPTINGFVNQKFNQAEETPKEKVENLDKDHNVSPANQPQELRIGNTTNVASCCSLRIMNGFSSSKLNQTKEVFNENVEKLNKHYNVSIASEPQELQNIKDGNSSTSSYTTTNAFGNLKFNQAKDLSNENVEKVGKHNLPLVSQFQELQNKSTKGEVSSSSLSAINGFGNSQLNQATNVDKHNLPAANELSQLQIKSVKYKGYSSLPITNGFGNSKLKQAKEKLNKNVEKVNGHYNLSTASQLQELQSKNTRHKDSSFNPEFNHMKDLVNGDIKKVDKHVVNFKNSAVHQTQELHFGETNEHMSVCTASSLIEKSKNDNQGQELYSVENLSAKSFNEKRNNVSKPKKINKKSKSTESSSKINSKLQVDIYTEMLPGMSENGATKLLKQLLQFHEDKNVVNIAKAFLNQKPDDIAKLVLQQVVLNKQSEIVKKKDRVEPPLTITEQALLKLMVALERMGTNGVRDAFLEQVEELLPTLTNPDSLLPITRLYVAICRQNFDLWRLRLTLCNSFILMHDLAIPFIHCMVRSWAEVLPVKEAPARNHIIARTIVYLILFKKCSQQGYNLNNLRQLLFKYYEYSSDVQDSKQLLIELFDCFIKERNDCAEVLALALCETLDKEWIFNHINTKLKESIFTRNSIYEVFYIIRLVTSVTKYFQKDLDTTLVENNKLWLKQFCDGPFPDCVKDGAKVSLLRLSKCK